MKVLVLHTLPPESAGPDRLTDEFDLTSVADNVLAAIPGGIAVGVQGDAAEVMAVLDAHRPDVVFNLCEAPKGRPDLEAQLAGLLELRGVPLTGSPSETLAPCRQQTPSHPRPKVQSNLAVARLTTGTRSVLGSIIATPIRSASG